MSMAADTAVSAPPNRRMVKMHDVMCRALLEGNKRMAKADLYACWDHTGMDKKAFDALTAQALGVLDGQIKEEVDQLCSEHKLEEKFFALESLIAAQGPAPAEEAPSAPLAAGGTPDPMEMLHSARQQVKREEKARLQGILAEIEKENSEARTQVKLKSVRLQDAKQRLAEQKNNLDQATACLGTLGR